VWGILLFMLGSALGTLYSHEWFATQIFHFMMARMDALKNMVASITTKIKILIMLSLLGGTFIGIFSIFSINYYVPSLYHAKLPKNHCMTVFDCIAEMYIKEEIGSEMDFFHAGRFAANTIYYIFMTLLFSNIVSGVLIDTFTELRERK
jgi:inositol 1,4,5-triphosphate receptor type 1/inositol 1,4,5-triphosphate receptor type 3